MACSKLAVCLGSLRISVWTEVHGVKQERPTVEEYQVLHREKQEHRAGNPEPEKAEMISVHSRTRLQSVVLGADVMHL